MTSWLWMLYTILLSCHTVRGAWGKLQPCEVETGQTNIIMDMEESRGNSIAQRTTPPELPIYGDPHTEIALELAFPKGNPMFILNEKRLQLLQPLDRDEENLSHIVFQISCTIRATRKKRNIPIIVRVSDVNDNTPEFINTPYATDVPESTAVGTTVFRGIQAHDIDAGVNGLVEYFIVESQNETLAEDEKMRSTDGYGTFAIAFPHQGQVTVVKTLDYERIQRYYLTIIASDRARNASERRTATTTLTINVQDSDDLDPSFIYRGCVFVEGACLNPEYTATVPSGSLQGVLSVLPEKIQAIDLDTIASPIRYSFESGMPGNYGDFFSIDEQTGVLKQIKAVDTTVAKRYELIVKAEEQSENKRYTTAKLFINVKPVDSNPPTISVSSDEGFVEENSAIGTKVVDKNGAPIVFRTSDVDFSDDDPRPDYTYELTTPFFSVDKNGVLVVNEENLDRDPPNPGKYKFQIVSRETNGNAASAPLSVSVTLKDVNDNPPKLPMMDPVAIQAGDETRIVTKVLATDNDVGENAKVTYSIFHVSNNGAKKFTIDPKTGVIETRGLLTVGEQYSITVQATDIGGLYTQAIVEITVKPGPNTKPPKFTKPVYEVQVSEGAEINATVIVVKANDPENDPVAYSIASGNDLRQFSIGQDNGVISVIRKLDREDLTRYQLILKAEDNGGLSTTSTVNIKVSDINDNNPEFAESSLPYRFKVEEGRDNAIVGTVHATDADEGVNAEISYSIPSDLPFLIDSKSGEIKTRIKLDYENVQEYKFVVTAKDGAPDSRLGTASVTVSVLDVQDEVPTFVESLIEVRVPENLPDFVIATVKAHDPDSAPQVTYNLQNGPFELFKVDPVTGQVKTLRGLDYEKEKRHELVVGTVENKGLSEGDTCKIIITVEDRNDNPPVFITVPEPITVADDQAIGTPIGSLPAIDSDGTAPGNVIRYELVGRGNALKYFQIDPDTAEIRVRDDLKKSEDTEFQLDVKAYDLGEPQLSSVAVVPVYIRHVLDDAASSDDGMAGEMASVSQQGGEMGLAFSDETYVITIPESTKPGVTLKSIQIMNSKRTTKINSGFKCDIIKGNIQEQFKATAEDNACVISLVKHLDYENKSTHDIDIKLSSPKYYVNPVKSFAKLKIILEDENDNAPRFVIPKMGGKNDTYYGVVSVDTELEMPVLQVKATDRDAGKLGTVQYNLVDDDAAANSVDDSPISFFSIDEDTGVIKLQKSLSAQGLSGLPKTPMEFMVEAYDNPEQYNRGGSLKARARVVINVIRDVNRMSLVFSDAAPKDLRSHNLELEELLSEKANNMIVGVEKFANRKFVDENGTVVENPMATDVWFYVIDPKTELILERNDSEILNSISEPDVQSEINFAASGIAKATAQGIYAPIEVRPPIQKIRKADLVDNGLFPYVVIAVSVVILILGSIGIVYICISWSKYKNFKQRMRQFPSTPNNPMRYDPVIIANPVAAQSMSSVSSPNPPPPLSESGVSIKEYETQVLGMTVNAGDVEDDGGEYGNKNHAFSMDNVAYITHKDSNNNMNNGDSNSSNNSGQLSPANSDGTQTTATISTLQRFNNLNKFQNNNKMNQQQLNNGNLYHQPPQMMGSNLLTATLNRQTLGRHNNMNNNPLASMGNNQNHQIHNNPVITASIPSTLTLGRLKGDKKNFNGYGMNSLNRSNQHAMGNGHPQQSPMETNSFGTFARNDFSSNTLGRNNHHTLNNGNLYSEVPISTSPMFANRHYGNNYVNHMGPNNDNVSYSNAKDYTLGFAYLNDLDRSDVETTTEL